MTGKWAGDEYGKEDPRIIFKQPKRVSAVHIYHPGSSYAWPQNRIEGALEEIGIERIVHILIKSFNPGHDQWRNIALDVQDASVYVFPTDFSKGIKYKVSRKRYGKR